MFDAQASGSSSVSNLHTALTTRLLTVQDIPAILALQEQVVASLSAAEKHFIKIRTEDYLQRLLGHGLGIGTFAAADGRLVAQALLRRQTFSLCEANCNVNNFLRNMHQTTPALAAQLLPELQQVGWGVIGTMLVSPETTYQRKGLARGVIESMMVEYQKQGGKHLFASTARDNRASQKVFTAWQFSELAEAVDPKDGWQCVIFHHPANVI